MHERPEFSFDRSFTVSRPGGFTCNGRRYKSGEVFDWRELGLSEAEIWDLWVLCQVDNVPAQVSSADEADQPSDPIAEMVAPVDSDAARGAALIPSVVEPPIAATAAPAASAAQGTLPLAIRPAPSSPPRPVVAKGVTKPPQQNQLPRR